jgi:methanogenic corrinoid protein MtbC1
MDKEIQDAVILAILEANRSVAYKLIDDWAEVHGYDNAVKEILDPVLEKIGEMWANSENISLSQTYIAGKLAEDLMSKVSKNHNLIDENIGDKGPIVIGNIEDDFHSFGRKMVVIFLRSAGWRVYDLGNDVTPQKFIEKALEVNASLIGASAMMYTTAMNIKKLRGEIDKRNLTSKIKLAVGGAVFKLRPELVEEVGGDGTATNAIFAPALMENLLSLSSKEVVLNE